jgi:serine/threonine-protein kinase
MQSIENLPLSEAPGARIFDGRYRLERVLEQSSLGMVYRAWDLALDETVCIELLPCRLAASNHAWATARSGLRKLAVLHHARIVEIYGFGVFSDGLPFVVTEHLAGASLRQVLGQGALPFERALHLGRQLCEAVGAAHRAGVLHGALEPAHVGIVEPGSEQERVKLRGFGLTACLSVRRFEALAGVSPIHHYVSPEHIQRQVLDARSDVYALGAMLYELVTGTPPFRGRDSGELLCQHLDDAPEAPSLRLGSALLSLRVFDKIVLRCLAKHPEQRYPEVAELERDLARLESALAARSGALQPEAAVRREPWSSRFTEPVGPTLCVHKPAPVSHVALRRPLPKVIISDAAR